MQKVDCYSTDGDIKEISLVKVDETGENCKNDGHNVGAASPFDFPESLGHRTIYISWQSLLLRLYFCNLVEFCRDFTLLTVDCNFWLLHEHEVCERLLQHVKFCFLVHYIFAVDFNLLLYTFEDVLKQVNFGVNPLDWKADHWISNSKRVQIILFELVDWSWLARLIIVKIDHVCWKFFQVDDTLAKRKSISIWQHIIYLNFKLILAGTNVKSQHFVPNWVVRLSNLLRLLHLIFDLNTHLRIRVSASLLRHEVTSVNNKQIKHASLHNVASGARRVYIFCLLFFADQLT